MASRWMVLMRNMGQSAFALFMGLIVGLAPSKLGWAQGQTVTVSPGANLQVLVNQYPNSTTFILTPGTYRLQQVVPKSYDTFSGQPGAVVNGAALLTAFTASGSYWIATAPVTQAASYRGTCNAASPACIYPEDLFFDSVPKTRVTALASVGPGKWFLNYSTGQIYMGDNPAGHTVEISLLPYAFSSTETNVTITGLTIEKYATMGGTGAIDAQSQGTYWSVTNNEIRFSHGAGINGGPGMYISKNKIHHNGQLGINSSQPRVLIQNNEISFNNYSGYSIYFEAGGVKFPGTYDSIFRYNYSHDNRGPGFWTDSGAQKILCDDNEFTNNQEAAILVELSDNVSVFNNYIWNDGYNPDGTGIWWGAAILISDCTFTSVYLNHVSNSTNGIAGILANRGIATNGQPYTLRDLNVNSNVITQATGLAAGIVIEGTGFDNSVYTSWNNVFPGNTYNLSVPNGNYFYWISGPETYAQWQQTFP